MFNKWIRGSSTSSYNTRSRSKSLDVESFKISVDKVIQNVRLEVDLKVKVLMGCFLFSEAGSTPTTISGPE